VLSVPILEAPGSAANFLGWLPASPGFASFAAAQGVWRSSRPPCLVARKQVGRRLSARLILEIDVGQRLPVLVFHDEAGVGLLGRPGGEKLRAGSLISTGSSRLLFCLTELVQKYFIACRIRARLLGRRSND
jgi:hypothetical protein